MEGINRNYYKTYYLISSILICFSIITFFIKDKIKQYLIISSVSLSITLYLFEGYLVFKDQFSKDQLLLLKEQLYEKQTGNKWDRRKKIEIYKDLKKMNKNITIAVSPKNYLNKNYDILPLSGISNSETIFCNENGYYSIYQSDRYGFNNPDNEWDKKEIDYILVGESFTQGACVNRPNDISSVLRKITNQTVLNLGYGGNGPLLEYATLKEFLSDNTKKVIWLYFEDNDFYDLNSELKNQILLKYLMNNNATQNIKFKQGEVDILAGEIIKEDLKKKKITKKNIIFFLKLNKTRSILHNYLPDQQLQFKTNTFIKILSLTKNLVNQNNSKLYFVYLPNYYRYKKNYYNTNYDLVKNIVNDLNIPFIDIHKEVFEKEQDPLKLFPFELDGHYTVNGYKKVAEIIYKLTKD